MTGNWSPLKRELEEWQTQGLTLPLWWRDDDATSVTEPLGQLEAASRRHDLPVHLAIIPKDVAPSLVDTIATTDCLLPIVHGWAHENHAPASEKKSEFGSSRPVEAALQDAEEGLVKLKQALGGALRPMFVPPWNRISPELLPWMAGLGFAALSSYGPRNKLMAAPGLQQINTHIDPIDWKGSRSLLDEDMLINQITKQLEARRAGDTDRHEPMGLLTHHLVHDAAVWNFCDRILDMLLSGPATPWRYDERLT